MSKSWIVMSANIPPEDFTYSIGGAAGSRAVILTRLTSPTSPLTTACRTLANVGSNRRLKPTWSFTPLFSTVSRVARTRSGSTAMGFSQNTCLPALAAASVKSAWLGVGEQISTTSISGSFSTSSGFLLVAIALPGHSLKST